jgi:LemA protein
MKAALIVVGILILVLVIGGVSLVGTRNQLVTEKQAVESSWASVDTALQRRADLIPNLVETVKGVAKQEQAVFSDIANARAALGGARTPEETLKANDQLSGALSRLLVIVENYPQLRSSESYNRLMDELAGTENRIAVERRRYNSAVERYNTTIQLFPKNIAAAMFGFQAQPYFQAEAGARTAPSVKF